MQNLRSVSRWYAIATFTIPFAAAAQGPEFAIASPAGTMGGVQAATRRVTLNLANVTTEAALKAVAEQAGLRLLARKDLLPARSISLHVRDMDVDGALTRVLAGTGLKGEVSPSGQLTIVPMRNASGQAADVTLVGRVRSAKTNQPVVGATVTLNGGKSVTTGADGTFRIVTAPGDYTVQVRGLGFVKHSQRVSMTEGAVTIEVVLEPSASVLDEVTVTGTVVATSRKELTNPITVITAADIERRGISRIEELFRGEIPGIYAMDEGTLAYGSNEKAGSMVTTKMYSRGVAQQTNGVTESMPIKTYIDGVEMLDPSYLGTIDPSSIDRVEIITGPQAATVYGSGAMGGVMQIFTKRGIGKGAPQANLRLEYGMLQNNVSANLAPAHKHSLGLTGSAGPEFSYSTNLSHTFTGQWQPKLFKRSEGIQVGMSYSRGFVTASGSMALTSGAHGTYLKTPTQWTRQASGEYNMVSAGLAVGSVRSKSFSQNTSLNVDVRPFALWHHHLDVGRNATKFDKVPSAPNFERYPDTLYAIQGRNGDRTSANYTSTVGPLRARFISSNVTFGVNGSSGGETQITGCAVSPTASAYVDCTTSSLLQVSRPLMSESWGGFANTQIRLFNAFSVTAGVRFEHNPAFGSRVTSDWTPSNGLAYAVEFGEVTLKLMGSYGRATKAPSPDQRLGEEVTLGPNYDPMIVPGILPNEYLRAERSRGPQGGFELYVGNRGSFSMNHYQQRTDDLIINTYVDSMVITDLTTGESFTHLVRQSFNVAQVLQRGWELKGSLNVGPFALKGAYTWAVSKANEAYGLLGIIQSASTFQEVPAHYGNFTTSYASRTTSVSLVLNFVGESYQGKMNHLFTVDNIYTRLPMYRNRKANARWDFPEDGYVKSDLTFARHLSRSTSLTATVINLGNSFGGQEIVVVPVLGRQTRIGLAMRWPGR